MKKAPLMTRWSESVTASNVHSEYPRPLMARRNWMNLNGVWDLTIERDEGAEGQKILVPFPVESALSGVMKSVSPDDTLVYRRTFVLPEQWNRDRILLHFGAADFETTVFVNGKQLGTHKGGYDPFSFEITDWVQEVGVQEIVVKVKDPTDTGTQPRGKQVLKPDGIWYTPTSGIWQTVWLEPVPTRAIERIAITPNLHGAAIKVASESATLTDKVRIKVFDRENLVWSAVTDLNTDQTIVVPKVKRWSPETPFLYRLAIELIESESGAALDSIESYFGAREIAVKRDSNGTSRIFLNEKPYFLIGTLDQGFWPDGLYTSPTDEALKFDLDVTKKLGFNFVRKHVKVEPARWYHWCDRIGLLVLQDMPSGDKHIGPNDPDITRTPASHEQFVSELTAMIRGLGSNTCIFGWVVFNEGWGQSKTSEMTQIAKTLDPTRIVISASGWTDRGTGDLHDWHVYPGPASPKPAADRAAFLGEFGGLGLPTPGHMWQSTGWGYRNYRTEDELSDAIVSLFHELRFLIADPGLSGAVYTQTTDVETETNGLMTYDRAKIKPNMGKLSDAILALFLPPVAVVPIVATSEKSAQEWSYTFEAPPHNWMEKSFDSSGWKRGPAGFGTPGTPGAIIRTRWDTNSIWMRRDIELPQELKNPHLRLHHDEDVDVYLDGVLIYSAKGYTTDYRTVRLKKRTLPAGRSTLAVHCRQTTGGQYVDVGIVDIVEGDNR